MFRGSRLLTVPSNSFQCLTNIPWGIQVIIKWRGKPVFIRHRTPDEIKEANSVDWRSLRDPQPDSDRVKRPEWLVMLGMCSLLNLFRQPPGRLSFSFPTSNCTWIFSDQMIRCLHPPWLCPHRRGR